MALRIRLRRMGRRNAPTYRIVVAESSMPRDGRIVESLGHYNPRTDPLTLSVDRARSLHWIAQGATPTDTVHALLKRAGVFRPEESVLSAAAATVTEAAKSAAAKAARTVKGAAAKAVGAVKAAAEDVRETAKEVAEDVREAAEHAIEAVKSRGDHESGAEPQTEGAPEAVAAPQATAAPEVVATEVTAAPEPEAAPEGVTETPVEAKA